MDELNPHGKKRLFYGFPPYSTVRCGAVFFIFFRHSYGAVRLVLLLTVRCGADHFFLESSVLCGAVLLEAKSYGTVRSGQTAPHRTAPHRTVRKKRTLESLEILR